MLDQIETSEQLVSKAKEQIIKETQRIEEAALFSAKGHFVASYFWSNFHLIIGIPIVVLAAIAGSSFFNHNNAVTGICSLIVAILSAVMTFLNPNERSSSHLNAGNSYDALQNEARIFRSIDCWREKSDQILTDHLKKISLQKNKLNQNSPQISWWAYLWAKRGIEKGEGDYAVDKEISSKTISGQIPRNRENSEAGRPE